MSKIFRGILEHISLMDYTNNFQKPKFTNYLHYIRVFDFSSDYLSKTKIGMMSSIISFGILRTR